MTESLRILIAEDEEPVRKALAGWFRLKDWQVDQARDGVEALEKIEGQTFDALLLDIIMPRKNGREVLQALGRSPGKPMPVVAVLTGNLSEIQSAAHCLALGADGMFIKGEVLYEQIDAFFRNAIQAREEDQGLSRRDLVSQFGPFVTQDTELRETLQKAARRHAASRVPVLILGESGTGKELLARYVHGAQGLHPQDPRAKDSPPRDPGVFVAVNCGALQGETQRSEIFGHVKGAYTGADHDHPGYLRQADHGTLFLDDVAELDLKTQVMLLRVIEDGEVVPLGGDRSYPVDVRIIAATNRDLEAMVRENRFREDLFYRLNVLQILLSPLRERKGDVPLLARHFARLAARRAGFPTPVLSEEALAVLQSYAWPGNVRELKGEVERLVVVVEAGPVQPEHLSRKVRGLTPDAGTGLSLDRPFAEAKQVFVETYIRRALERSAGNISQAAKAADLDLKQFRKYMDQFGLREGAPLVDEA